MDETRLSDWWLDQNVKYDFLHPSALLCDRHGHRTRMTKARANAFAKRHVHERSCRIFLRIGLIDHHLARFTGWSLAALKPFGLAFENLGKIRPCCSDSDMPTLSIPERMELSCQATPSCATSLNLCTFLCLQDMV